MISGKKIAMAISRPPSSLGGTRGAALKCGGGIRWRHAVAVAIRQARRRAWWYGASRVAWLTRAVVGGDPYLPQQGHRN